MVFHPIQMGACCKEAYSRRQPPRERPLANNSSPPDITSGDCLQAIDSLIHKGLLVELQQHNLEADLTRWRSEPLAVSFGVDRNRHPVI